MEWLGLWIENPAMNLAKYTLVKTIQKPSETQPRPCYPIGEILLEDH